VVRVHRDHPAWLEAELVKPFAGQTIVVTHHAPMRACVAEDAQVPTAYASDLSILIATHKPDQWLFGHAHHPVLFP
jgi:Icc-related predicted phosphoesterase